MIVRPDDPFLRYTAWVSQPAWIWIPVRTIDPLSETSWLGQMDYELSPRFRRRHWWIVISCRETDRWRADMSLGGIVASYLLANHHYQCISHRVPVHGGTFCLCKNASILTLSRPLLSLTLISHSSQPDIPSWDVSVWLSFSYIVFILPHLKLAKWTNKRKKCAQRPGLYGMDIPLPIFEQNMPDLCFPAWLKSFFLHCDVLINYSFFF